MEVLISEVTKDSDVVGLTQTSRIACARHVKVFGAHTRVPVTAHKLCLTAEEIYACGFIAPVSICKHLFTDKSYACAKSLDIPISSVLL
jgi:hypothetical protein